MNIKFKNSFISIKNVSKNYYPSIKDDFLRNKSPIVVLRKVNLEIKQRSIIGIGGRNGSGKTTLLKLMSALLLPTTGEIIVNDYSTEKLNKLARSQVASNFNNGRSFFRKLTGRENIDFLTSLEGIQHGKIYNDNIRELSSLFELDNVMGGCVETYSIGMKERLGYLLSLIIPRDILIYDDFANNLDDKLSQKFYAFLERKISDGSCKTIILSSPKIEFLKTVADKYLFIEKNNFRDISESS